MGEVNTAPEVAAKVMEDLTAMEVDAQKGERLFKAAIIQTKQGTTYRMLAKVLGTGRLDLVHYACELDEEGKPTAKWAIRRILDQPGERFHKEVDAIQTTVKANGDEVLAVQVHDLTGFPDVAAQGASLEEWSKKMVGEIRNASA